MIVLVVGLLGWSGHRSREWVVSRAVDRGECATSAYVRLEPKTPTASRELFATSASCNRRIVTMLNAAPDFMCRADRQLTVCTHPLNMPGDTTYVRAIVAHDHVLLETIPS